jgi:hypothetical protein
MMLRRLIPAGLLCLLPALCHAQTSFTGPDGKSRYPGVTIFCPSGTGVVACNFAGGSSGTTGTVSIQSGGATVSASNRFPVGDSALDALINGGALTIGGSVSLSGTPSVTLLGTPSVSLAGTPTVSVGAGSAAIGSVSVSNLPATQPVSVAALPLPTGAATATAQTAPLGPVAPGTATASNAVVIGCQSNTTLPSFTAGQQGAIPCDGSGRPYVVTVPSANNVPTYLQAVSSGGTAIYRAINAAASAMAANVKTSSGSVYGYEACNSGTVAAYLRLFALATAPVVGTSTPAISKLLSAGSCQGFAMPVGLTFSNGIGVDVTSGSMADNDTAAVTTASQVTVEIYYT